MLTASGTTKKQVGFTIVELLIVIVVIAILAAITVGAYNGIQQRARNTGTINTAVADIKLIKLYIAGESTYPSQGSYCLQLQPESTCLTNSSLKDNLAKYGSLPTGGAYVDNISYNYASTRTVDENVAPLLVIYSLDGIDQDCGTTNVVKQTGGLAYTTDNSVPRNTANVSGTMTRCYVSIPHPN